MRTFDGPRKIKRFLNDRLKAVKLTNIKLGYPSLVDNSPVAVWIQSIFTFDISDYGSDVGVALLILTPTREWKGYTIYTGPPGLRNHPEQLGEHGGQLLDHSRRLERRQRERVRRRRTIRIDCEWWTWGIKRRRSTEHLGVATPAVEKNAKNGDNWRNRCGSWNPGDFSVVIYPTRHNQFLYIPFPSVWPTFTP